MAKCKKDISLKGLLRWQLLAVVIAILIYAVRSTRFLETLIVSLVLTNSIAVFVNLFDYILKKKFTFSRLTRWGKMAYFAVITVFGTSVGTLLGLSILTPLFKENYFSFLQARFMYFFYLCIVVAVIYTMFEILYSNLKDKIEKKVRENEELKHLQVRTQLMALQAKVNPHFLFNTLNTMLNLVHKHPQKVEAMILNLSDIYRRVLQLPEHESIPLKEELHLVKEYLDIEKIRLDERLSYSIHMDPSLENLRVPPLLIEPVVENAVIHGISPKADGGTIQIGVEKKENILEINITDNGVGMEQKKRKSDGGFGLHSVQERMRLLYKDKARFSINLVPGGGTRVTLELPHET